MKNFFVGLFVIITLVAVAVGVVVFIRHKSGDSLASGTIDNSATYEWHNAQEGGRYIQLTASKDPTIFSKINKDLAMQVMTEHCDDSAYMDASIDEQREGYSCTEIRDVFLKNNVLILYTHEIDHYLGAYPTDIDANNSITYDLISGERVDFCSLFSNYDLDKKAILSVLRPFISSTMGEDQELHNTCDEVYTSDSTWDVDYEYSLTPRGLEISTRLPHVVLVCEAQVTVPYASLSKYFVKNGVVERYEKTLGK